MKPSTETLVGTIDGYDERRGILRVSVPYNDWPTFVKRGYSKCLIQLKDERPLSHKQRANLYSMLNSISAWSGMDKDEVRDYFKLKFIADVCETGEKIFSLSDCPMSLAVEFQKFLIDFIIRENVPVNFDLLSMVDDVKSYVYSCLVNRRCAKCGKTPADLHHWTRIGIGRSRDDLIQIGWPVMPLCRECHQLCHSMPQEEFDALTHLEPVEADKTICHIYKLKIK